MDCRVPRVNKLSIKDELPTKNTESSVGEPAEIVFVSSTQGFGKLQKFSSLFMQNAYFLTQEYWMFTKIEFT